MKTKAIAIPVLRDNWSILVAFAIALAAAFGYIQTTRASSVFVPDVARYVDNVNYRDPQWIVRVTTARGEQFVQAGLAETRLSGPGTIGFSQDEAVTGFRVILADGRMMERVDCFLRAAPMAGTVTDGVVNPPGAAINGKRYCEDADFRLAPRLSGPGTIPFNKGEPVVGYKIIIAGREYNRCNFSSAPEGGQVTDGVVFPTNAHIAGMPPC